MCCLVRALVWLIPLLPFCLESAGTVSITKKGTRTQKRKQRPRGEETALTLLALCFFFLASESSVHPSVQYQHPLVVLFPFILHAARKRRGGPIRLFPFVFITRIRLSQVTHRHKKTCGSSFPHTPALHLWSGVCRLCVQLKREGERRKGEWKENSRQQAPAPPSILLPPPASLAHPHRNSKGMARTGIAAGTQCKAGEMGILKSGGVIYQVFKSLYI